MAVEKGGESLKRLVWALSRRRNAKGVVFRNMECRSKCEVVNLRINGGGEIEPQRAIHDAVINVEREKETCDVSHEEEDGKGEGDVNANTEGDT